MGEPRAGGDDTIVDRGETAAASPGDTEHDGDDDDSDQEHRIAADVDGADPPDDWESLPHESRLGRFREQLLPILDRLFGGSSAVLLLYLLIGAEHRIVLSVSIVLFIAANATLSRFEVRNKVRVDPRVGRLRWLINYAGSATACICAGTSAPGWVFYIVYVLATPLTYYGVKPFLSYSLGLATMAIGMAVVGYPLYETLGVVLFLTALALMISVILQFMDEQTLELSAQVGRRRAVEAELRYQIATIMNVARYVMAAAENLGRLTARQRDGIETQSAAVMNVATALEELHRSAEHSARRAEDVAKAAKRSDSLGKAGLDAVGHCTAMIGALSQHSAATTEHLDELDEHTSAIDGIITALTEFAEESNYLAVNAAIQASHAGPFGRGFSVVAMSIKELAVNSKNSVQKVRHRLEDIKKASEQVVSFSRASLEQIRGAEGAVSEAGRIITKLTEIIEHASRVSSYIATSTGQQAQGTDQVRTAMKSIDMIIRSSLEDSEHTREMAEQLDLRGIELRALIEASQDESDDYGMPTMLEL